MGEDADRVATDLVSRLGNKAPGQLIKSADWNNLVQSVQNIERALNTRVASLETTVNENFATVNNQIHEVEERVDKADERIAVLTDELGALQAQFNSVLGQYYRVTMETSKATFALGELAQVTAKVTDLLGNPLNLTNPADRPFIDFVSSYGRLKAVAGFESLGGVDDRTLSVQADASGVARVILRAEHVEGFTDEDENEIAATLTTKLPNNATIAEVISRANTPMEANISTAFRTMTAEYDRPDGLSLRSYVDSYYINNKSRITGRITPNLSDHVRTRWRDYRSTVMAFAKRDNNPLTPDQARGVSSIQVTFRDWISPWIILDYTDEVMTRPLVDDFRGVVRPHITKDFNESILLLKNEVKRSVVDKGLVGKIRTYDVMSRAFNSLAVDNPPAFLNNVTQSLQNAVNIQSTLAPTQFGAIGLSGQEVAFDVFTDAAIRADSNTAGLSQQLGGLQSNLDDLTGKINTNADGLIKTRRDLDQLGLNVTGISNELPTLRAAATDVGNLRERIGSIDTILNNPATGLGSLRDQIATTNQAVNTIRNNDLPVFRSDLDAVKKQASTAATGLNDLQGRFDTISPRLNDIDKGVLELGSRVTELDKTVVDVRDNVKIVGTRVDGVQTSVGTLRGQVDTVVAEGGPISRVEKSLQTMNSQVQNLQSLNATDINSKILTINGLENRLTKLERGNR